MRGLGPVGAADLAVELHVLGRSGLGERRREEVPLVFDLEVDGPAHAEVCEHDRVLVDVAHLNRKGLFEVCESSPYPVICSHTACNAVHILDLLDRLEGPIGFAVLNDRPPTGITDVRYMNEVEAIWKAGGRGYRIDRDVPILNHSGEEQLDEFQGWDGVIDNNGSITDLYGQVKALVMGYTLDVD